MLTSVAGIGEPLWRVKSQQRSPSKSEYCFHGYKDLSFVAIFCVLPEKVMILGR